MGGNLFLVRSRVDLGRMAQMMVRKAYEILPEHPELHYLLWLERWSPPGDYQWKERNVRAISEFYDLHRMNGETELHASVKALEDGYHHALLQLR